MSLLQRAVQGAAWTVISSVLTRAVVTVGTVVVAWFLSPAEVGQVAAAHILVFTFHQLTVIGFGQYVITHREEGREAVFHATVLHLVLGAAALGAVYPLRDSFAELFAAPEMGRYVPGFILMTALDRLAVIPEAVLAREMRFRTIVLSRSLGDLSFCGVAIALAAKGVGAASLVWANVARSLIHAALVVVPVYWREWLAPCRLELARFWEIVRFGAPLAFAAVAAFASRRWDNLLYSRFFGPAQMGLYNHAYNLADIPATQVGEQIGDVLMPSFANLERSRRAPGLVRAVSLLSLIMLPMAVGLAAIADSLVASIFNEHWQGVAPLLTLLAFLSVSRPIGWVIAAYLQADRRTVTYMVLEVGKVVLLLVAIALLAGLGPVWASLGAGIGFGIHALASVVIVSRQDRIPASRFLPSLVRPLAACVPLLIAVLGVRHGLLLLGVSSPVLSLVLEVLLGAAAYVPAALLFAPEISRDFLGLLRRLREGAPPRREGEF